MAVIKIKTIKKNLQAVVNYAKNGEKTEYGILVSGVNCLPQSAYEQMALTKRFYHKENTTAGYHIIQSKIAIGSGMLFGIGLFGGTQSQLNFLPENHTDFIFAVVGEEFGFIGAAFLLCLYLIVLWRGVKIARECKDAFGMLLASGITSMLAFHLLVNVGMTMGVMPVTGIPLPLMSYGVSSLLTNVTCLGLLMNIHMKQQSLHF